MDVIVVARTDDEGNVELACSPFHVRFGKLSVWAPVDRKASTMTMKSSDSLRSESRSTASSHRSR